MNKPVTDLKPESEIVDPLELMRRPFPANAISKLPKETGTQAKQRKADQDAGKWPPKCAICEGYHHPKAVHLDYVGHAALTDRLLDADPKWNWRPMAFTPEGLPLFDKNGGLWMYLTVDGVERIGYGSADGKTGGDAIKEVIGDALRNSGMRFGAALDLWHKGVLHLDDADERPAPADPKKTTGAAPPQTPTLSERADKVESALRSAKDEETLRKAYSLASRVCAELSDADPKRLAQIEDVYADALAKFAPPPTENDLGIGDDEVPY